VETHAFIEEEPALPVRIITPPRALVSKPSEIRPRYGSSRKVPKTEESD
jgi:hypothetical protein